MSDTAEWPAAEGGGLDRTARPRQQSPRMTAGKFSGLLLADAEVEVLWEIFEVKAFRMDYAALGELRRRGLIRRPRDRWRQRDEDNRPDA